MTWDAWLFSWRLCVRPPVNFLLLSFCGAGWALFFCPCNDNTCRLDYEYYDGDGFSSSPYYHHSHHDYYSPPTSPPPPHCTVIATVRGWLTHDRGGRLESVETGVALLVPPRALPPGPDAHLVYFKVCRQDHVRPVDTDVSLDDTKGTSPTTNLPLYSLIAVARHPYLIIPTSTGTHSHPPRVLFYSCCFAVPFRVWLTLLVTSSCISVTIFVWKENTWDSSVASVVLPSLSNYLRWWPSVQPVSHFYMS